MSEAELGALAPYWHLFEALGSDASIGEVAVSDGAESPLLYIGAGLGTYPGRSSWSPAPASCS